MKWERTLLHRKGWARLLATADSWLRLALETMNFGNGITTAGKLTVFLIQFGCSKERKGVKNAGFTRSINDLDHNWHQVEFLDAFEVVY
jgi:hypothetical protein